MHALLDVAQRLAEPALELAERRGDGLDALLGGDADLARRLLQVGLAEGEQHDEPAVVDLQLAERLEQLDVGVLLVLAAQGVGGAAERGELPGLVADPAEGVVVADLGPVAPGAPVGVDGGLERHLAVAAHRVGGLESGGRGRGVEVVELVDASHPLSSPSHCRRGPAPARGPACLGATAQLYRLDELVPEPPATPYLRPAFLTAGLAMVLGIAVSGVLSLLAQGAVGHLRRRVAARGRAGMAGRPGSGLDLEGTSVRLVPLGATVLVVLLVAQAARWIVADPVDELGPYAATVAGTCGAVAAVLSAVTNTGELHTSVVRAAFGAFAVGGIGSAVGAARKHDRTEMLWFTDRADVRAVVRGAWWGVVDLARVGRGARRRAAHRAPRPRRRPVGAARSGRRRRARPRGHLPAGDADARALGDVGAARPGDSCSAPTRPSTSPGPSSAPCPGSRRSRPCPRRGSSAAGCSCSGSCRCWPASSPVSGPTLHRGVQLGAVDESGSDLLHRLAHGAAAGAVAGFRAGPGRRRLRRRNRAGAHGRGRSAAAHAAARRGARPGDGGCPRRRARALSWRPCPPALGPATTPDSSSSSPEAAPTSKP